MLAVENMPLADMECTPSDALRDVKLCRGRISSADLLDNPTGAGGWKVVGPHPLRPDRRGAGPLGVRPVKNRDEAADAVGRFFRDGSLGTVGTLGECRTGGA